MRLTQYFMSFIIVQVKVRHFSQYFLLFCFLLVCLFVCFSFLFSQHKDNISFFTVLKISMFHLLVNFFKHIVRHGPIPLISHRGGSSFFNQAGGGPNSEIFLPDRRKLFKRVQFFVVSKFLNYQRFYVLPLISFNTRNCVYINQFTLFFYKNNFMRTGASYLTKSSEQAKNNPRLTFSKN